MFPNIITEHTEHWVFAFISDYSSNICHLPAPDKDFAAVLLEIYFSVLGICLIPYLSC
jgi:hypothetical protein